MEKLLQDLRYGVRVLVRSPGFTLVAVLSLALGMGANTAVFTLLYAVLLQPIPAVEEPSRLMALYTTDERNTGGFMTHLQTSYLNYKDYRDQNESFSALAAHQFATVSLVAGSGPAEQVVGLTVSGNYFDVLGVKPRLGRFFLPDEDRARGLYPVVVLSHGCWQRRFGGDPSIVGKTISMNGTAFTVVGVAGEEFRGTTGLFAPEFWVPIAMGKQVYTGVFRDWLEERRPLFFDVIGRLKPGVSQEQALANVKGIASRLEQEYPTPNKGRNATLLPLTQATMPPAFRSQVTAAGGLLMVVVGLVLLIACSNVANLLVFRASARRKEIAIRLSMGAGRRRMVRQLVTESLLLGLLGGALGLLVARWGLDLLWAARPPFLGQNLVQPTMNVAVLGFTVVLSLLTGLLFGLVPALQASRPKLSAELKNEVQTIGHGPRQFSLRNLLVVAQVALSLVALIGAGLFIRSLQNAQEIDPGFVTDHLAAVTFDVGAAGYDAARGEAFQRQIIERVEALPGVQAASFASILPLAGGGMMRSVFPEGRDEAASQSGILVPYNVIGRGYFETLGVQLVRGRAFTEADRAGSPYLTVINETMAKRVWPNEDPIGKRFRFFGDDFHHEVVGVARDGKYFSLGEDPQPFLYVPMEQHYTENMTLQVRTTAEPAAVLGMVQKEIRSLDRSIALVNPATISEVLAQSLWAPRMGAALLGIFGALALGLASVGIYGVMAYSVTQRTPEIGIRMAMGARREDILRFVLRQGMALVAVGVILGLGAALALAQLVPTLLFGVGTADPVTFATTAGLLALVAFLANYVPARRATRVDPVRALRFQ
jgi:predicted permease